MREVVTAIEGFEERVMKQLEELGARFELQVERLDQVQTKVNLSMASLGEVHQEQVSRTLREVAPSQSMMVPGNRVLGAPPDGGRLLRGRRRRCCKRLYWHKGRVYKKLLIHRRKQMPGEIGYTRWIFRNSMARMYAFG